MQLIYLKRGAKRGANASEKLPKRDQLNGSTISGGTWQFCWFVGDLHNLGILPCGRGLNHLGIYIFHRVVGWDFVATWYPNKNVFAKELNTKIWHQVIGFHVAGII